MEKGEEEEKASCRDKDKKREEGRLYLQVFQNHVTQSRENWL